MSQGNQRTTYGLHDSQSTSGRKGYGRRALELLIEHVKTRPGAKELLASYVPIEGGPENLYRKLGFEPTGEDHGGEVVITLLL
jgi:diamine N-acetyltransferase